MKTSIGKAMIAGGLAVFASLTTLAAAQASGEFRVAQGCGWYVVLGCFQSWDAAEDRANGLGAIVVDTNNYPNFRNGWFCAVDGPYSRGQAKKRRWNWKSSVPDAYAKSGC